MSINHHDTYPTPFFYCGSRHGQVRVNRRHRLAGTPSRIKSHEAESFRFQALACDGHEPRDLLGHAGAWAGPCSNQQECSQPHISQLRKNWPINIADVSTSSCTTWHGVEEICGVDGGRRMCGGRTRPTSSSKPTRKERIHILSV